MRVKASSIRAFKSAVIRHYRLERRDFPWRKTRDPYRILVSEIMLQQTQADRVVERYEMFIKRYPTVDSLDRAPLRRVLRTWQGLGYNRRALMLKRAANVIKHRFGGSVPSTIDDLVTLPGVGPYTAAAVMAFAYNKPAVMVETNIRSVFIHHFFPNRENVADEEILPLIRQTLDRRNARMWYAALMDYGANLKRTVGNPSRRSRHHNAQGSFEGSNRQIRGSIIRALVRTQRLTAVQLGQLVHLPLVPLYTVVEGLVREGLVVRRGQYVTIGTLGTLDT